MTEESVGSHETIKPTESSWDQLKKILRPISTRVAAASILGATSILTPGIALAENDSPPAFAPYEDGGRAEVQTDQQVVKIDLGNPNLNLESPIPYNTSQKLEIVLPRDQAFNRLAVQTSPTHFTDYQNLADYYANTLTAEQNRQRLSALTSLQREEEGRTYLFQQGTGDVWADGDEFILELELTVPKADAQPTVFDLPIKVSLPHGVG